ncbi:MAG: hypothetical protein V5786_00335 [Psychromonas sp.]
MQKLIITFVVCACAVVLTAQYHDQLNIQKELLKIEIQEKKLNIQVLKLELSE